MRQLAIAWSAAIFVGALLLVLTSTRFTTTVSTDAYYRQPGFFPAICLSLVALLALLSLVRALKRREIATDEELAGTVPRLGVIVPMGLLFAGYIVIVPWIGYLASTVVFCLGALAASRTPRWGYAVSLIILAVLLHLGFESYMDVWFPESSLAASMSGPAK